MASRQRMISPEFFQHGALYDVEERTKLPVRVAFAGLWTKCDRRGIFAWKPRELKLAVMPYDPVNFADVLDALCRSGFVLYYEVEGRGYGVIPSFGTWQTFHQNEKPDRKLPEPLDESPATRVPPGDLSTTTAPPRGEHEVTTAPPQHGASTTVTVTGTITGTDTSTVLSAPRSRRAKSGQEAGEDEKKYPHFGQEERGRCIAAFRKVGEFDAGRVVKVLAPFFRPATDPAHIPHDKVAFAVEDYCGVIGRGFSARWVSPEDCAKKLMILAKNCVEYEHDPFGRLDAQMVAVHGSAKVAA